MAQVQQRGVEDIQPGSPVGTKRVPVGSPIYNDVVTFLYEEATLLDQIRLQEWAERLDTDLVYTVPLRQTRVASELRTTIVRSVQHYHDDYRSIMGRILRLSGKSAWAEDPPSRCRRFVTNVRVAECDAPDQYEVVSYLYVERSRGDNWHNETVTAERRDIWRAVDGGYKLSKREIICDQSTLSMSNFAIFF